MHPAILSIHDFILPIVSILIILIGFSATSAQLLPEIRAGAYLLQAQQAIRDGDQDRARTVIRCVRALQEQYDMALPNAFHFRYAKAAVFVEMPEQALEFVLKNSTVSGRLRSSGEEAESRISCATGFHVSIDAPPGSCA